MNALALKSSSKTGTYYRLDRCLLCGSKELDCALPLAPSAIGNDYSTTPDCEQELYSLRLFLCRACGNVQIEDVVDPELLFRTYAYSSSSSLGLVAHFRRSAANILVSVHPPKGSLVVDIGSNDGALLRAFRGEGMRVLGVDPAVAIARTATAAGVETVPEFFTSKLARDLRDRHGPAAIITANNVFAHSDQLADMADGIRALLAPDGVFVFEVSYLVDIVQKMLFDTVYHEHLCYHAVQPLAAFFARHRLRLVDVERIPTKGGSIRGTVRHVGSTHVVRPAVAVLTSLELELGLDKVDTYRAYADRIAVAKNELLTLLGRLRAEGKTIAGYGASPTVTTLLFQFDLGDKLDFLVDDNPAKQGTFSPGHKIPVFAPHALSERTVDYVVILAWNYAEPIIARQAEFVDRGGRFIVPLPSLRAV
jgi:SAM-dependent methyltransferase